MGSGSKTYGEGSVAIGYSNTAGTKDGTTLSGTPYPCRRHHAGQTAESKKTPEKKFLR